MISRKGIPRIEPQSARGTLRSPVLPKEAQLLLSQECKSMHATIEIPTAAAQPEPAEAPTGSNGWIGTRTFWILAIVIGLLGVALRVVPTAGFARLGFDESLYRTYVVQLDQVGLSGYPAMTELFLQDQRTPQSITKLPPTRFVYIYTSWLWKRAFFGDAPPQNLRMPTGMRKDPALVSLHHVACLFSILTLGLSGIVAARMFDRRMALAVLALFAFSPLQLHMSQHALIDGVLAFWAFLSLWLLWENLRKPDQPVWLASYAASLAIMVMTKENSFFVFCALMAVVVANRWLKFGTVTPRLLLVSVLGPLAGVTLLVALAGGTGTFIEVYTLLVSKAQNLDYAIKTGDGPWYRYFVDLLLISPIVLLLAVGGGFRLATSSRTYLYLLLFVAASYLIMCNVRYGMNLRYAIIWEFPLRVLAFGQLCLMTRSLGARQSLALVIGVAALCAYDFRQYLIFNSDPDFYELATFILLKALAILK
jgi:hypothetical protein